MPIIDRADIISPQRLRPFLYTLPSTDSPRAKQEAMASTWEILLSRSVKDVASLIEILMRPVPDIVTHCLRHNSEDYHCKALRSISELALSADVRIGTRPASLIAAKNWTS